MDRDDRPVGDVLSRREALTLLGASGAVLLGIRAGSAAGRPRGRRVCVARPQQTEGPYFVDEKLLRSDIRSDPTDASVRPGSPLDLTFHVSRLEAGACTPLAGVVVDLWQCDHLGVYSDVRDRSFDTTGKKFLRGYQVTDQAGAARFTTVYPGWYQGRTVHLHFKLRSAPAASPGFEFTSQLYFDDALTDRVFTRAPYADRGARSTRNERDGIYRRGGAQLELDVTESPQGFAAAFEIALDGV
jgi:protocatechuate 3,4-dioxygenase beta subunit